MNAGGKVNQSIYALKRITPEIGGAIFDIGSKMRNLIIQRMIFFCRSYGRFYMVSTLQQFRAERPPDETVGAGHEDCRHG